MSAPRRATPVKADQTLAPAFLPVSQHRKDAALEAWICERLKLRDLFAGVTSTDMRRDRLHVLLLERGLADAIAGKVDGHALTWRAVFKKLYGAEIA